ncbi:spore germination protein [Cohnella lupini]|uniref:Spore germination protein KA/spore germination protein n=1 Tax=Cohnella lupini TaxID=1294267 RepID=A0A3D9ISL1_9BACL|nr:spore germination protein [Cohnella lupini]RED64637.1 spore germination protein KA/spore germination protein [Cohnella lupini]
MTADHLSKHLKTNIVRLQQTFSLSNDFEFIRWQYGPELKSTSVTVYLKSIIHNKKINYMRRSLQDLVEHDVGPGTEVKPEMLIRFFEGRGASTESASIESKWSVIDQRILQGNVVIFLEGWDKAVCYEAKDMETRQVTEPETEPVVQGPREGTVENLLKNIGMIRTRIQSPALKIEAFKSGGYSNTTINYMYIQGVVDPELLKEFKLRINKIGPGEILDPSYIEELIEDYPLSPFPQFRYTERTDVAAAALLNGKILVLSQGSGSILVCPGLFFEFLQSSEDYYQRVLVSNFIRWLRLVALLIAISLPSIYIAMSTFHTELIPTVLLLAIIDSREGIPFGAFMEAVIMVFFFELLKEAGIRLPRPVGSAVSIVGALVIGEAAINAGIASPIMVVVVSLTGIASFSLPQYNLSIALRLIQFPLMALSAMLGGFGILLGYLFIWLHLVNLTSLNVPYLTTIAPWKPRQFRDTLIRTKLPALIRRTKPPSTD